jgi:hypothetical protein
MIMATVPVMHEEVHERACREEQPRQPGQDMRPVLGKQKKSSDDGKGKERELHPWAPSALVVPSFFRHGRLLVHDLQLLRVGVTELHFRVTSLARHVYRHLHRVRARAGHRKKFPYVVAY